jgi:hypothetical protein
MVYSILFLALAALAYWYWSAKFVPKEVRENAADFEANRAADDLQRGYHGREMWSRVWPALACCVVSAAPLAFANWGAAGLGFLAMVALIGGYFARYFTPLLNLARSSTRLDIGEWYASPDSKSWPDAAVYKKARAAYTDANPLTRQQYADHLLERLLTRTWLFCRAAAFLLACAAVALTL